MLTREQKDNLFNTLVKIKNKINRQFPLAANRFEKFECFPIDPALNAKEKQDFIDAGYEKFNENKNRFKVVQQTHEIYQQLNQIFTAFLKENQISTISQITTSQRQAFQAALTLQAQTIFTKIQRRQKYLPDISLPDIQHLEQFLQNNATAFTEKLMNGKLLRLDDKDLAYRMELFDRLRELRERNDAQVLANVRTAQLFDKKVKEKLKKLSYLTKGLFLKKENARVGFCDEHTALAIFHIGKKYLIHHYGITMEVIGLKYFDDKGNENDGHVFLAINRDPVSQLNDIASWGQDAILFDAWNKLVCYAEEYHSLPTHYVSYPSDAKCKWAVIACFNEEDRHISHAITLLDRNYYMTGNSGVERRIPLIMDEYHLSHLNQAGNKHTSEFLYKLSRDMRPNNFNFEPELFLTTGGDEFICVIPGFTEPKIAIHKDFAIFSQEEMQFAMAQALVLIQHHWAGMADRLSADEQFKVDSLAVKISKNGAAAISFLRKSIAFKKEQSNEERNRKLIPLTFAHDLTSPSHADQIKALMTLFALDEYHYLNTKDKERKQTPISDTIKREMSKVSPFVFFEGGFKKCRDNREKINYLTSCLSELKKELMPYELSHTSVRVKDFCRLIRSIEIDFQSDQQCSALDELFNVAHKEHIPGFEEIYFAVHGQPYVRDLKTPVFQPFGPFNILQIEIRKFIEAKSFNDAKNAAFRIKQMRNDLKTHFNDHVAGLYHTEKYEKNHEGRLPTGDDRYFGSVIGPLIDWQGFVVDLANNLPWKRHMKYATNSLEVAETLWDFGLQKYAPLWNAFPPRDLLRLHQYSSKPFLKIRGRLSNEFSYSDWLYAFFGSLKAILTYLSLQHPLCIDMFDKEPDFRQAFNKFYDNNWQKLVYPQVSENINGDNEAVRYLLEKFGDVASRGTENEIQVIKDFFSAPKTQRGLRQLQRFEGWGIGDYIKVNSPYITFLIDQMYQEKRFTLFTAQELAELLHSEEDGQCYTEYDKFPILTYLKIYNLPFDSVTIECLEEIYPLIRKQKLRHDYFHKFVRNFFEHNKPIALSSEMVRLIPFMNRVISSGCWYLSSSYLNWQIPANINQLNNTSLKDVIHLYRYYDNHFIFPDLKIKQNIGLFIMKEIMLLNDKKKIDLLEALLLQDKFTFPLSDMNLRTQVINLWVSSMAAFYGKDTGLIDYQETLLPVIKRVLKYAANRDIVIMLEKLAVSIESQWKISEFLGEQLERDKFLKIDNKKELNGITQLSIASKYFSDSVEDQHQFLDFISTPMTKGSLMTFANYIKTHKDLDNFHRKMNPSSKIPHNVQGLRIVLHSLYFVFWDRTLEQRAIIIDHVITPSSKVKTDKMVKESYQQGFDYIAMKLLPQAENPASDDHFAYALIKAYLDTADKYIRGILLSGMLVASNEASQADKPLSAGKKIAMLCEHMGPAYIKLAQAVHSHPGTPEHIRRELNHVKGKAHPPYRWQLWRLAQELLTKSEFDNIKRIGQLLGSASYNLALEIELKTVSSPSFIGDSKNNAPRGGMQHVVLLLLRENAKRDAEKGFKHLRATILACDHPKMISIREAILSIIQEAEFLSTVEMDKDKSEQQYHIAAEIYKNIKMDKSPFSVSMSPVKLLSNGYGYRFIERVYGEEFNNLPLLTQDDKLVRQAIATTVVETELVNILSGQYFDSDRHGNQLRAEIKGKNIHIGLYDFGEMSLAQPIQVEINQVTNLLYDLPNRFKSNQSFGEIIEQLLSEEISKAKAKNEPASYLMRIWKACLALQDFQKELSKDQLIAILKKIMLNDRVHPNFRKAMLSGASTLAYQSVTDSVFGFFSQVGTQLGIIRSASTAPPPPGY